MKKYDEEESLILIRLGRRLSDLRKLREMTQETLSALCNSEEATISRMESGKVNSTVLTLNRIAIVLQVPLAYLLG